jgi:hypothetical protein
MKDTEVLNLSAKIRREDDPNSGRPKYASGHVFIKTKSVFLLFMIWMVTVATTTMNIPTMKTEKAIGLSPSNCGCHIFVLSAVVAMA